MPLTVCNANIVWLLTYELLAFAASYKIPGSFVSTIDKKMKRKRRATHCDLSVYDSLLSRTDTFRLMISDTSNIS
ncbi:hypothetical protein BD560DRAFT_416730 [Blakeslea trispora]|nr:hypothetical protein BD560DRAFT_416730 [Blakeslea trispora]